MRKIVAVAALAALAAGCASVSTGGLEVTAWERGGGAGEVRVDDARFAKCLSVESAVVRREPSGFASAHVVVRNEKRTNLPVQYKFRFYGADGVEIQPGARAWEQKTLHGGEADTLSAVAPDKAATGFTVRVRRVY